MDEKQFPTSADVKMLAEASALTVQDPPDYVHVKLHLYSIRTHLVVAMLDLTRDTRGAICSWDLFCLVYSYAI